MADLRVTARSGQERWAGLYCVLWGPFGGVCSASLELCGLDVDGLSGLDGLRAEAVREQTPTHGQNSL